MKVEIVQIESDDVVDAIKQEIEKNKISKLVIAASSNGMFSRYQIGSIGFVFVTCVVCKIIDFFFF